MTSLTPEQTSFLLLGALVAVAILLLVVVIFVGTLAMKAIGYVAKFKGFQAGRNAKAEMTFTCQIDETPETPKTPKPWFWERYKSQHKPVKRRREGLAVDGQGHPIPARDLAN